VVALNYRASVKVCTYRVPCDLDSTLLVISGGLRVTHRLGDLLNLSSSGIGVLARERTPSLGVIRSNLSLDECALILSVLAFPEAAHGKSAAFLLDVSLELSITDSLVLLEDAEVAGLEDDFVRSNFLLLSKVSHSPADLDLILSDVVCFQATGGGGGGGGGGDLRHNSNQRCVGNAGSRSGLDLEVGGGPASPAEDVLGANSVEVSALVDETAVGLVEVASREDLRGNPVGVSLCSPLEFVTHDLQAHASGVSAFEALPVDIDGGAGDVGIVGSRSSHGSRAADDILSSGVLGRELVGSAMLVESTDHHLDEVSLDESGEALDGAISVGHFIEHGDNAFAVLDDLGVFTEAGLLEFEPRSVLLLEDNLVSEDGSASVSVGSIPSDFNVSSHKLDCSDIQSVRTGSGSEGENWGVIASSTDILSTDSESVLLSFFESENGGSIGVLSLSVILAERPFDSLSWVSLVPDDFEFSILVVVGPGEIEGSDCGESEFLEDSHGDGLSADGAAADVRDGNGRPSSLVVSSSSSVDHFSDREFERLSLEDAHGDSAGKAELEAN